LASAASRDTIALPLTQSVGAVALVDGGVVSATGVPTTSIASSAMKVSVAAVFFEPV